MASSTKPGRSELHGPEVIEDGPPRVDVVQWKGMRVTRSKELLKYIVKIGSREPDNFEEDVGGRGESTFWPGGLPSCMDGSG